MRRVLIAMFVCSLLSMTAFCEDKNKIAFVDVTEILMKYQRQIDSKVIFKIKQDKYNTEVDNRIKKLRQVAEDIKESTDEAERLEMQFDGMKREKELKYYKEVNKAKITMEFGRFQLQMIQEIKKTINDIGIEKKYFMILQTHPPMPGNEQVRNAIRQINVADVMYYNKKYDITDIVIARLNLTYINKKAVLKKTEKAALENLKKKGAIEKLKKK